MDMIKEWLTPKGYSGRVLLNISSDQIRNLNRNQLGDLYEQLTVELLHEIGFSDISRVNTFYDIEARKRGKNYYIEVKGRMSGDTSRVSAQLEKLEKLAETASVYWMFINLETIKNKVYSIHSFEHFLVLLEQKDLNHLKKAIQQLTNEELETLREALEAIDAHNIIKKEKRWKSNSLAS